MFLLIIFYWKYTGSRDSEEVRGPVDSIPYSFTFVYFADVISDQFTNFVDFCKVN